MLFSSASIASGKFAGASQCTIYGHRKLEKIFLSVHADFSELKENKYISAKLTLRLVRRLSMVAVFTTFLLVQWDFSYTANVCATGIFIWGIFIWVWVCVSPTTQDKFVLFFTVTLTHTIVYHTYSYVML